MYRRKIALYVEGQTEQILISRLIQAWWIYSKIKIENIKTLTSYACEVPNYSSLDPPESQNFFLIVDVGGEGSLCSSITQYARKQHQQGYTLIGLRDLYAKDYEKAFPLHKEKTAEIVLKGLQEGLKIVNCDSPEKIEIFFSIMEIETWLLAFSNALSEWGKGKIPNIVSNLESIPRPSRVIKDIAREAGRGDHKSVHEVTSFVKPITYEDILEVYESNRVPSFTRFWKKILSLTE